MGRGNELNMNLGEAPFKIRIEAKFCLSYTIFSIMSMQKNIRITIGIKFTFRIHTRVFHLQLCIFFDKNGDMVNILWFQGIWHYITIIFPDLWGMTYWLSSFRRITVCCIVISNQILNLTKVEPRFQGKRVRSFRKPHVSSLPISFCCCHLVYVKVQLLFCILLCPIH